MFFILYIVIFYIISISETIYISNIYSPQTSYAVCTDTDKARIQEAPQSFLSKLPAISAINSSGKYHQVCRYWRRRREEALRHSPLNKGCGRIWWILGSGTARWECCAAPCSAADISWTRATCYTLYFHWLKYQQNSTDPLILGFNHLQMGMEEVEEEWERVPPGIV